MPLCIIVDGGVSRTFLDHAFTGIVAVNSRTFSMNCGNGGDIVACVQVAGNSTLSSVTIGGITATQQVLANIAGVDRCAIYTATGVPSGTQNVVITNSASSARYGCQLYSIIGHGSLTPDSTASDTTHPTGSPAATLNVSAGGCAIGCGFEFSGTSTSATSSGLTEDADDPDGVTGAVYTSQSGEFPSGNGSLSVSFTFNASPARAIGAWAVWKP